MIIIGDFDLALVFFWILHLCKRGVVKYCYL